ncbi:MAG: hypothetical protein AAF627_09260 [Myxococcota bacterium]
MSKHYDFAVVGGRLASVITSALLSKRGLRGILIDQGELASRGAHGLGDFIPRAGSSAVMDRVHQEVGLRDDFKKALVPMGPSLQIVEPESRWDFTNGDGMREVARGLGLTEGVVRGAYERVLAIDEEIGGYLAEAPEIPVPSGFFSRRSGSAAARKIAALQDPLGDEFPGPMVDFWKSLVPFMTHFDPGHADEWSLARLVRPFARLMGGAFEPVEGKDDRGIFIEAAKRSGLDLRTTAIEGMELQSRSWSLQIRGQRDPVLADAVVDASTDLSGLDVVPSRQLGRQLPTMMQAAKPRGGLHVLGIEVDEQVLPPPMGRHVLLSNGRQDPARLDPAQPDTGDRPVWIVKRAAEGPGRIQLLLHLPVSSLEARESRHISVDDVLRARLERLIPFLEDGRAQTFDPTRAGRFGPPILQHPFLDPGLDDVTGFGGVSMRTGLKSFFLAGPAVVPGLGREGEYLSAVQAAGAVEALLRR